MPVRWERLNERRETALAEGPALLYGPVDPVPLEAAGPVLKRRSVRDELQGYLRDMRTPTFVSEETEAIKDQLRDFLEEDEDDQVLSEYQIELLAREIAHEDPGAYLVPREDPDPPADPPPDPAAELGAEPGTVPTS